MESDGHDLFTLFLDEVKTTWRRHRLRGVLPWVFGLCAGAGYAVAARASHLLFTDVHWGTLAAVYAGVLTFNGIALALTWTAIGKIYDTITRGEFARFLRVAGSVQQYQFYIQFMHLIQILAAVTSVLGLFITFAALPELVGRIALGAVAGTTLYSIKWAGGSVRIVRDLTDRQVEFDGLPVEEKRQLMLVAENSQNS